LEFVVVKLVLVSCFDIYSKTKEPERGISLSGFLNIVGMLIF